MKPEDVPSTVPWTVRLSLRLLHADLRQQEQRRRHLLWEIAAVRLWQQGRAGDYLARWITLATIARRDQELGVVDASLTRIRGRIEALLLRFPEGAALLPADHPNETAHGEVSGVLLQRPIERRA